MSARERILPEWTCPQCGASHPDETAREECGECEAELCESCAEHVDLGIVCGGCS